MKGLYHCGQIKLYRGKYMFRCGTWLFMARFVKLKSNCQIQENWHTWKKALLLRRVLIVCAKRNWDVNCWLLFVYTSACGDNFWRHIFLIRQKRNEDDTKRGESSRIKTVHRVSPSWGAQILCEKHLKKSLRGQ